MSQYKLQYTDLAFFHAVDMVVKVPAMAESISEGTLKQFSKSNCFLVWIF